MMKKAFAILCICLAVAGVQADSSPNSYSVPSWNRCDVRGLYNLPSTVITNSIGALYLEPALDIALLYYFLVFQPPVTIGSLPIEFAGAPINPSAARTSFASVLSALLGSVTGGSSISTLAADPIIAKSIGALNTGLISVKVDWQSVCYGTPANKTYTRRMLDDGGYNNAYPTYPGPDNTQFHINANVRVKYNDNGTYGSFGFPVTVCAVVYREQYSGFGLPTGFDICNPIPSPSPSPPKK